MKLFKKSAVALSVVAATFAAAPAMAVDVTTAVADITALETDITTVGTALIGLAVVAVGIKWIKASFFS